VKLLGYIIYLSPFTFYSSSAFL